jgi:hypothetical protein
VKVDASEDYGGMVDCSMTRPTTRPTGSLSWRINVHFGARSSSTAYGGEASGIV